MNNSHQTNVAQAAGGVFSILSGLSFALGSKSIGGVAGAFAIALISYVIAKRR